jgi:serine phosphatase RsbU (regulator of sigma subunit)
MGGDAVAGAPVTVAAASRPHPLETLNGDAWAVDWHGGACRIAVVDGLGHGPRAAAASAAATAALAARPDLEPAEALRACHRALAGTRGAAVSIARIDVARSRLTYVGVGNVEARFWHGQHQTRPIAYRGIVGATLPSIRTFDFDLGRDWVLLIHTDGVSPRFHLDTSPVLDLADGPRSLAEMVLRDWGRLSDDATVVVACPAERVRPPGP